MRSLCAVVLASALAGCAATKQEVAATLGDRFIGKNADALVSEFGPPASTFRMNSGETAYVWQLTAVTSINMDHDRYGSSGTAKTNYCKVSVIASTNGTVTKLTTEDASGTRVERVDTDDIGWGQRQVAFRRAATDNSKS